MTDAPAQPKTLTSYRIVTDSGEEKLTPWFDNTTHLVEYIEQTGGQTLNKYQRDGEGMYELVAGERLAI